MSSHPTTDLATTSMEAVPDPSSSAAISYPELYGEAQIARLFEMTSDLLAAISLDGQFTLLNPAWEQVLGWSIEEIKARPMQELVHPDDLEQTLALTLAGNHRPAQFVNFTNRYRHRDGSWRWLLWSARCDGEAWYAAAKDVTDRMWLERQALHDPLTKLPNRLLLMDRARQAVARLRRSKSLLGVGRAFVRLGVWHVEGVNESHRIERFHIARVEGDDLVDGVHVGVV